VISHRRSTAYIDTLTAHRDACKPRSTALRMTATLLIATVCEDASFTVES
jgi:hypothetical protein